jgi:hypothetical protein
MASPGATVLRLAGALAVLAASFVITLKALDQFSVPVDPATLVIQVVEATYGKSCENFTPPAGYTNQVKQGNVTAAVAKACDKAQENCHFVIDDSKIVDPAPGCAKDFLVSWRCGSTAGTHRFHLGAEANGKTAVLSCAPS